MTSNLATRFPYLNVAPAPTIVIAPTITVPSAPTSLYINSDSIDGSIVVSCNKPDNTGGLPITGYIYSLAQNIYTYDSPGSSIINSTTSTFLKSYFFDTNAANTITGLTVGLNYSIEVQAINTPTITPGNIIAPENNIAPDANITSGISNTSLPVSFTLYGLPGVPTNLVAVSGDKCVDISFNSPTTTGGLPIKSYQYYLYDGKTNSSLKQLSSPLRISNLINGTKYTIYVQSCTEKGYSDYAKVKFTPCTKPTEAPTNLEQKATGDRSINVSFTLPNNGGSVINKAFYYINGDSYNVDLSYNTTDVSCNFTIAQSLSYGNSYSLSLACSNIVGAGPSTLSTDFTIYTAPGAPTLTQVRNTNGNGYDITYSEPYNSTSTNTRFPITRYVYDVLDSDNNTLIAHDLSFNPSNPLDPNNGTFTIPFNVLTSRYGAIYTVELYAINAIGPGDLRSITICTTPTAPSIITQSNYRQFVVTDTQTDKALALVAALQAASASNPNGAIAAVASLINALADPTQENIQAAINKINVAANTAVNVTVGNALTNLATTLNTILSTPNILENLSTLNFNNQIATALNTATTNLLNAALTLDISGNVYIAINTAVTNFQNTLSTIADTLQAKITNILTTLTTLAKQAIPYIASSIVTNGIGRATISFNTPSKSGGSPITGYLCAMRLDTDVPLNNFKNARDLSFDDMSGNFSIGPLINGRTYHVELLATNKFGNGVASTNFQIFTLPAAASMFSENITLSDVIGVPSNGCSFATIKVKSPNNGGTNITGYSYKINGGEVFLTNNIDPTTKTFSIYVPNIVPSVTYDITDLKFSNICGYGNICNPYNVETLPTSPTLTQIISGNGTVDITFNLTNVSSNDTYYCYYSVFDEYNVPISNLQDQIINSVVTNTAASINFNFNISILNNGSVYNVYAYAVNSIGTGQTSPSLIIYTPPEAPVNVLQSSYDNATKNAVISFTQNGDTTKPFTYEYSLNNAAYSPIIVTNNTGTIQGGTGTNSVIIRAKNAIGTGPSSDACILGTNPTPFTPTQMAYDTTTNSATISFSTTDTTITSFEYSLDGTNFSSMSTNNGALTGTINATIYGLTYGQTNTVTIRAINNIGSTNSTVSIGTPPTAPTGLYQTSYNSSTNSATIAAYTHGNFYDATYKTEYYIDELGWQTLSDISTIPNIYNSTINTIYIREWNYWGVGTASEGCSIGTTPGAPTNITQTEYNIYDSTLNYASLGYARISFSPPAISWPAIDSYQYSTDGGSSWSQLPGDSSSYYIQLNNGTTYNNLLLRAVNTYGTGTSSSPFTICTTPLAPIINSQTLGTDGTTTISFTQQGDSTGIYNYEFSLDSGAWTPCNTVTSPFVLGYLTNGQNYNLTMRANVLLGTGIVSNNFLITRVSTVPSNLYAYNTDLINNTISVDFIPAYSGGSPVTTYYYVIACGDFATLQYFKGVVTAVNLGNGNFKAVLDASHSIGGTWSMSQYGNYPFQAYLCSIYDTVYSEPSNYFGNPDPKTYGYYP